MASATEAWSSGQINEANVQLRSLLQRDAENVAARSLLAEVALATGDFAGAEHSARRALDLGADSTELRITLLQSLEEQGKFSEIVQHVEASPRLRDDAQFKALTILGTAKRGLNDTAGAEAAFRAALSIAPDSIDVQTRLAAVLIDVEAGDEARRLVSAVLRRDPRYVPALQLRASMVAASALPDAAESTWREIIEIEQARKQGAHYVSAAVQLVNFWLSRGELESAAAMVGEFMAANPRDDVAHFLRAEVEFREGQIDLAERRLRALLTEAPEYWAAYRLLGTIDAQQNQMGQAEQSLRLAINKDRNDLLARLQLAELYVLQGEMERAAQLFEDSPAAQLGDSLFLALVGEAEPMVAQPELAATYFARSERLWPEDMQQLAILVRVFAAAGEHERAIRLIEVAFSYDPPADYLAALVSLRQGNVAEAEELANRLIEIGTEEADAYHLRGSVAFYSQEFDEARDFLLAGLNLDPTNTPILLGLARVALGAQDFEAAEHRFREVVAIDATNVNALFGLAELAAGRGDNVAARAWLASGPDFPMGTSLVGRLEMIEENFDAAADSFARAFEGQPTFESANHYFLAALSADRPTPDEKLLAWVATNPFDARANFVLGGAELAEGSVDQAIERFEAVITVQPRHIAALNSLSGIYSQRGDDRALDYATRASEAAPNIPAQDLGGGSL